MTESYLNPIIQTVLYHMSMTKPSCEPQFSTLTGSRTVEREKCQGGGPTGCLLCHVNYGVAQKAASTGEAEGEYNCNSEGEAEDAKREAK